MKYEMIYISLRKYCDQQQTKIVKLQVAVGLLMILDLFLLFLLWRS